MSWANFETIFKAGCKAINESHKNISLNTPNNLTIGQALADALGGIVEQDAKDAIVAALAAERVAYLSVAAGWPLMMDAILAYGGTQLTTPSKWVRGNKVLNRTNLLRDLQEDMFLNTRDIDLREVTYAADPTQDNDTDVLRVTVDRNGEKMEAGLHNQNIDLEVVGNKATGLGEWQTDVQIAPRNQGADIFQLLGPIGKLTIRAVNEVNNPDGVVANPNLNSGINSTTADAAVTSLTNWTLSNVLAMPTHVVDRVNVFRSLALGHKIYGTTATRRFSQNLNVRKAKRFFPHGFRIPVFKEGAPTGNIVLTWGSKSQTWTMASLSAGWNYLSIDRDLDMYPENFDSATAVIQLDVECTTGSAAAYTTIGAILGQVAKQFNGNFWFAWSQVGKSTLGQTATYADTMTVAGKNATALYLAYHTTKDRDNAWLPAAAAGSLDDYA